MAAIPGVVRFTGIVGPSDTTDTYAVIDPVYGIGGYREVADTTALNAITSSRRRVGMMVYVQSDSNIYQLVGGIENANWTIYNGKQSNINGTLESPTTKTYVIDLYPACSYVVQTLTVQTVSGSCILNATINDSYITNLTNISANTNLQTISATSNNVVTSAQPLKLSVSGISSVEDLQFSFGIYKEPNIDTFSQFIETPTDKTYTIDLYSNKTYTIDYLAIKTDSGTCTASLQINDVDVTSLNSISVNNVLQKINATGNNIMTVGDKLTLVITGVSLVVDLQLTIGIH